MRPSVGAWTRVDRSNEYSFSVYTRRKGRRSDARACRFGATPVDLGLCHWRRPSRSHHSAGGIIIRMAGRFARLPPGGASR